MDYAEAFNAALFSALPVPQQSSFGFDTSELSWKEYIAVLAAEEAVALAGGHAIGGAVSKAMNEVLKRFGPTIAQKVAKLWKIDDAYQRSFSNSLERLDEVAFRDAINKGHETLAGFKIYGNKGKVGDTFNRNIFLIESDKKQSISKLFNAIENEAKASGANKISIAGVSIINPKIISPRIAKRYGYTFEKVGDNAIILQKKLD